MSVPPPAARGALADRIALALGRWPIALAIAFAAALQCLFTAGQSLPRYAKLDFSCYYVAASALRQGADPYTRNLIPLAHRMNLDVGAMAHIADTPALLSLLEPLTLLDPEPAHTTWLLLNAILLGAALWMLLAELGDIAAPMKLSVASLALMYPPLSQVFVWGQSQILVLFLLVIAMRSLERRPLKAGAGIAIAALLRAFPLLLGCYLLVRRRWVALGWTALFGALGTLVTIAVAGPAVCANWVRAIGWNTGYWQSGLAFNIGIAPFVSRLFWYGFGPHLGTIPGAARECAVFAAEAAVLFAAVRATPLDPRKPDRDGRAFAVWIAAAIVLSPIAWPHLMPLLLIPFAAIAADAVREKANSRALIAMGINYLLSGLWLRFWAVFRPHFYAGTPSTAPAWVIVVAELGFPILMLGFLAACWSAASGARALVESSNRAAA